MALRFFNILLLQIAAAPFSVGVLYLDPPFAFVSLFCYYLLGRYCRSFVYIYISLILLIEYWCLMLGYFSGDLVWYPVRHVGLRLPTSTEDHSPGHLPVPDEHQRGEPPGPRPPHIKAGGLQVCSSLDILLIANLTLEMNTDLGGPLLY